MDLFPQAGIAPAQMVSRRLHQGSNPFYLWRQPPLYWTLLKPLVEQWVRYRFPAAGVNPRHGQFIGNALKPPSLQILGQ
jgi:hypothetical protein